APEVAAGFGVGAVRLEGRLHGDFDLMRDGLVHGTGILAPSGGACTVFLAAPAGNRQEALAMSADRLAQAKALLARLIAFDSVSDSSNLPVVAFVEDYLASHGVSARRAPNAAGDKAAILATIGPRVDGGIVLSGHTDVVPVAGQPWSSDPFGLREAGGRLYGRGACDMKGFDACVLAMVPAFQARPLKRPVHIVLSYD